MDIWVVAAAAGAGYVAQHLKTLTKGKHFLSDSSSASANIDKPDSSTSVRGALDKTFPFCHALPKDMPVKDVHTEVIEASTAELPSTSGSGGENVLPLDNLMICSASSNSDSLLGFLNNEDIQEDWEGRGQNIGDVRLDLSPQLSARETRFSYGIGKNRNSLRTRRTNRKFIKPLTSLESCLMAQLYKEHSEIEEYTLSSIHSPCTPATRPFIVTDGSRIISRSGYEYFKSPTGTQKYKLHESTYSHNGEVVLGVPRLPKVVSLDYSDKAKTGNGEVARSSNYSRMVKGNRNNSHEGQLAGALNFYLGFSIGIISSFLAHKREMEKLNALLKQTENLVQDLQEELDMKDSLTMKELAVENYESQDIRNEPYNKEGLDSFSSEQKLDSSTKYSHEEYDDQNAEATSLSNIEAELEAELERLEFNMSSSKLEKKISDLAEVDKDFMADIVEGELRADLFDKPYIDQDGTGSSTRCSVHYAVSPRELSLRLHKLVQSQLEERVKELETALENSQRKIKTLESKHTPHWSTFSDNGAGSYKDTSRDQPVIINLSEEALAAYSEAYDEFAKVTESDEGDIPSELEENNDQDIFQGRHQVQNDGSPHYTQDQFINGSPPLSFDHRNEGDNRAMSYDVTGSSTDENGDEEMERLLIRQIVEKARKGSPVVLNAQRALFSTDEYLN